MPVTQAILQQRALHIRDKLVSTDMPPSDKQRLLQFRASNGWVSKFVKRHALRSVSLCGEAGSASAQSVAVDMSILRERLREYDTDCIFNVDETGLFYKLLPRRTYLAPDECRKSVRGTKAMKAKDSFTAYVCTNANGSEKLPMAVIGKAKNPRCFRLGAPTVPYLHQKNAWSVTITFRKWFLDIFLPFVRKFTSRKCVLLMDNCGPHGADIRHIRGQVELLTLPPNCTSIHQPMDLGIISAWKTRYRSLLLLEIISGIETRQSLRESSTAKRCMRGLEDGFDPHMLDVCRMLSTSWEQVSAMTISRCWRKSLVLPAHYAAELNSVEGKMSQSTKQASSVLEMVEAFIKLRILSDENDPIRDRLDEQTGVKNVKKWLFIEEDVAVKEALVEDALLMVAEDVSFESCVSAECDSDEDDRVVAALPAESDIHILFRAVEAVAVNAAVADAILYIRRAKGALLNAKRRERGIELRQTLITELL